MANLTKEQVKMFTWIGSAVLIFIWLFIPSMKMSFMGFGDSFNMVNGLSGLGFLYTITILLLFLCPLYLLLYSFKDKMAALKPIFVLDRKVAGIVLAAVAVVFILLLFIVKPDGGIGGIPLSPAFGAWLYLIIAAGICYLGIDDKK
ncbi:MAG: hypothetical protein J5552_01600 [Prevotella sp.]|nr:hypothetical protein [Prevotella sp.]